MGLGLSWFIHSFSPFRIQPGPNRLLYLSLAKCTCILNLYLFTLNIPFQHRFNFFIVTESDTAVSVPLSETVVPCLLRDCTITF